MKQSVKSRLSNIELLRIVAMSLIIASHLSYYGGAFYHTVGADKFIAGLFLTGGKLGVSLFVMIGAIFMAQKDVSFKSILRIILVMFAVETPFALVLLFTGKNFSIIDFFNPINKYWFVNVYVGLMLVSPWLNKLIRVTSCKEHRNLCLILTGLCAVFPTLRFNDEFTNQFIWFVYLYILINFIIKHKSNFVKVSFKKLYAKVGLLVIACLGYFFMTYMIVLNEKFFPLRNSGSIVLLIVALCLFLFFLSIDIGHIRFVNWVAKGTFVAYLVHDNGHFKNFLWEKILKCNSWYESPDFLFIGLLTIAAILLISAFLTFFIDKIVLHILKTRIALMLLKTLNYLFP